MVHVNESAARPFSLPVRVYFEDTDAAGVVYYAGYLRFLERGRTEWLRALGIEQQRLAEETGVAFAVRSLGVEYLRAARLDDALMVITELASLGHAQALFHQRIERAGERLVEATVRVACIDARRLKPIALPKDISKKMGTPA